ncbi:hypothetical protein ACJMK2_012551 [Sinanodonta woodiana]|uniref:Centromere protein J n=1 Tax=Sinanodonta woodiana TaxID=1069815 RepID=A0ABD3VA76_SINWO
MEEVDSPVSQGNRLVSSPNSSSFVGGPVMDADIPSQMFMHTINFERMKRQFGSDEGSAAGDLCNSEAGSITGELSQRQSILSQQNSMLSQRESLHNKSQLESSMDLLEQHQSIEQARLLQRFKELRQWQLQQQEVLMRQQQQQLEMLKLEQQRVQSLISHQRNDHWGGGKQTLLNPEPAMSTPPRRQLPVGMNWSQLLANSLISTSQPKGELPKPVIYTNVGNGDVDEYNTNPDLFSDTNSQTGSQVTTDEGVYPIPESASEASGEVRGSQNYKRPEITVKAPVKKGREMSFHLNDSKMLIQVSGDPETDEGIGTQSFQSTQILNHRGQWDEEDEDYQEEKEEMGDEDEEDGQEFEDENDVEEAEDEEIDESVEEEEELTQIENKLIEEDVPLDERPIKSGLTGQKTFEELLEEEMKAEEERLKQLWTNNESPSQQKRPFLKKGEGLSRFTLKGESKAHTHPAKKSSANQKTTLTSKPASKPGTSQTSQGKSVGNQTQSSKSTSTQASSEGKSQTQARGQGKMQTQAGNQGKCQTQAGASGKTQAQTKPLQVDQKLSLKKGTTKSPVSSQIAASSAPIKEKQNASNADTSGKQGRKPGQQTNAVPTQSVAVSQGKEGNRSGRPVSPGSIPDDASFIASLKEHDKNAELDKVDLEEFEILEHFADNMSFCSNSSLVVRVADKDAFRARLGLKVPVEAQSSQNKHTTSAKLVKNTTEIASVLITSAAKSSIETPLEAFPQKYSLIDKDDVSHSDSEKRNEDWQQEDVEEEKEANEGEEDEEWESENSSDEDSDSDTDLIADLKNSFDVRSPMKILTRKVAGRDIRTSIGQPLDTNYLLQKFSGSSNTADNSDILGATLDTSAFAPNAKSPIVISKEISTQKLKASINSRTEGKNEVLVQNKKLSYSNSDEEREESDSEKGRSKSYNVNFSNGILDSDDEDNDNDDNDDNNHNHKDLKRHSGDTKREGVKNAHDFDDNEAWEETMPTVKVSRAKWNKTKETSIMEDAGEEGKAQFTGRTEEKQKVSSLAAPDNTPPTSKLVERLFPKLKSQQEKQLQKDQQKLQLASQAGVGDGVQSKLFRDKLVELEKEIERFREENANLEKLRKEREEGLTKLKKEITDFEKEKSEELQRLQEFKAEEMRKLKHERKLFDQYQKQVRSMPDKKEREEIEMLKTQLTELQEEMKRKENRWTSNNSRLRAKIEQLEQENNELKEEIKLMERKRLEWLQKDQIKVPVTQQDKGKGIPNPALRSSTPTGSNFNGELDEKYSSQTSAPVQNGGLSKNYTRDKDPIRETSSFASSIKSSSMGLKQSQQTTKVNVKSSLPSGPQSGKGTSQNTQNSHSKKDTINQSKGNKSQNISQKAHNDQTGSLLGIHNLYSASLKTTDQPTSTNVINSLTEDTPRNLDSMSAFAPDTSLYSETDGSVMGGNMPRKSASRISLDKSAIDKGDGSYEETQHPDGKIERLYNTGAREILFSNGTRKEISADGMAIIVSFFNGDFKQIYSDQRVTYYYAETQTSHTTYPDGLEVLHFPNNQVEKHYPDGTKEITFPDQTMKYLFPNGSEESIFPDGTIIRVDKNGDKMMEFPNGQREIHTQDYKRREYPDGTVKTVYPDGRQETRYSNGRLRIKDRDGHIIVDRHC